MDTTSRTLGYFFFFGNSFVTSSTRLLFCAPADVGAGPLAVRSVKLTVIRE